MGLTEERIKEIFLGKGIPYSKEAEYSLNNFENALRWDIQTEGEYMRLEEQLNAVLAQYEEESFWYGFCNGIHLLLAVLTDR